MPRWKLKDCPRCGGDLFMDVEEDGWLGHCLQCGYMGRYDNAVFSAQNSPLSVTTNVNQVSPSASEFSGLKK
jgi:ribosomal protein S27AE